MGDSNDSNSGRSRLTFVIKCLPLICSHMANNAYTQTGSLK